MNHKANKNFPYKGKDYKKGQAIIVEDSKELKVLIKFGKVVKVKESKKAVSKQA